MAGNSPVSKITLNHATETLQKTCNRLQKSKDIRIKTDLTTQNFDDHLGISGDYATWPSSKLRTTIEEAVKEFLNDDYSKIVLNIIDEVECELNNELSPNIAEQLDFCMMCIQVDQMEAFELQRNLCSQYDLAGKVFWESLPLGQDLFSVFEDMVNNSTRVLFYISERFDDTDACAFIARNLLVEQDKESANRKVIPLVTEFDTPIPEMFQLIDKLYLCSKLQFQFRFPAVFTREVKLEKALRAKRLKKKLDNERKAILQSLIQRKLGG